MTTTTISYGRKVVVLLLQVARRVKKRCYLNLPQDFDINPKLPLQGKLLLLHHSMLEVTTSDTSKLRGMPSGDMFEVVKFVVHYSFGIVRESKLELM
jgi:hypothetical protein